MKRVMNFVKQNMIGFVLGILLTGIGVVTATSVVPATGVAYSNSASEATTVNEALDELFAMADKGESIVDLGIGTTFDLTSYPDYQIFTAENFIVEPVDLPSTQGANRSGYVNSGDGGVWINAWQTKKLLYDASSGELSASYILTTQQVVHMVGSSSKDITIPVHAYLIK